MIRLKRSRKIKKLFGAAVMIVIILISMLPGSTVIASMIKRQQVIDRSLKEWPINNNPSRYTLSYPFNFDDLTSHVKKIYILGFT